MRIFLRVLGLFTAGVLAWRLLQSLIPGGSERFYLLVPPLSLTAYLLLTPDGWRELKKQLRPALVYLAALALFSAGYNLMQPCMVLPGTTLEIIKGFRVSELFITTYFFASVSLIVILSLTLLRWLCRQFSQWIWNTRADNGPSLSRGRIFLQKEMPALLLVPLFFPYLLGAMYVHRFKIPNPLTPREIIGRAYEDVAFVTGDGLTIRGWFIPAREAPSSRTLIICHGLANNRSNALTFHEIAAALEANILVFDFRGHGDSDGHTVTLGHREKLDVLAAIQYLRGEREEEARHIIGMGISMGSAGLIRAAAEVEPPLDAVIIDSGFASAVELTDNILEFVPAEVRPWLAIPGVPLASLHAGCSLEEVRPVDDIANIRAPLLIVHARGDGLIPVGHAQRLYEHAADPKTLWITETGNHCSSWAAEPAYLQKVKALVPSVKSAALDEGHP